METIVTWTKICIAISVIMCGFFVIINPKDYCKNGRDDNYLRGIHAL